MVHDRLTKRSVSRNSVHIFMPVGFTTRSILVARLRRQLHDRRQYIVHRHNSRYLHQVSISLASVHLVYGHFGDRLLFFLDAVVGGFKFHLSAGRGRTKYGQYIRLDGYVAVYIDRYRGHSVRDYFNRLVRHSRLSYDT